MIKLLRIPFTNLQHNTLSEKKVCGDISKFILTWIDVGKYNDMGCKLCVMVKVGVFVEHCTAIQNPEY